VNEARTQARKIIQDAEQQAATMKAEAHQIGRAQAQAELQTRIAALESLVVEVENWRQSVLDGSEREVIELVLALGRKLFGRGLRLPAEILHESFSEALVKARPLGDLRFHLNPVDLERLGDAWQGEQELRFGKRIELVPDAQVLPGGCLIEGQFGEVDGQADAKWQRVEAFFSNPEELGR
jgi:flagellar assembly protein FliH